MDVRPGIGQQVALWTCDEPPLYIGSFLTVRIPDEWTESSRINLALQSTISSYRMNIVESLMRRTCKLRIGYSLTDKYDPESLTPYTYDIVANEVTSGLLFREVEGHSLLLFLQEHPIFFSCY